MCPSAQLLGEYSDVSGVLKPTAEYVWMDGQPIAVVRPKPGALPTAPNSEQEVFLLHPDHLGAPRVAVDLNGQLRWRWMGGEPFGVLPPEDNPSSLGPLYVGLRFPGQVADGLVELYYNVFRDYDASVGTYVQSDPIGLGGGINTYSYVGGNPVSYADPRGLSRLTNQTVDGKTTIIENPSGKHLIDAINGVADGSILTLQISGHGDVHSQCISAGGDCSDTLNGRLDVLSNYESIGNIRDALRKKMKVGGDIRLEGCNNASGDTSVTRSISRNMLGARVTGGVWYQLGYENHWLFGNSSGSIGVKRTYVNGVKQ